MTRHIGLLRGINVGGNNLIAMVDLRTMLEDLGFTGAKTILQSGNVVFEAGRHKPASIETMVEARTLERFGAQVDWFVRTADEWDAVIEADPFPRVAEADPSHYLVFCLEREPKRADVTAMQSSLPGKERVHAAGRQLYVTYPDGIGKSKLTMPWLERKLGLSGTARNWNTVLKLQALARAR
jgi:uncharacterized protein (DUF1697 family)